MYLLLPVFILWKMIKKSIFIIALLYCITLLQTSFFVQIGISSVLLNFVLITVVIINIFENQEDYFGIISAFLGGFFLDIFSEHFFGFYILISLAVALFIKLVFRVYVRIPVRKRS